MYIAKSTLDLVLEVPKLREGFGHEPSSLIRKRHLYDSGAAVNVYTFLLSGN